MNKEYDIIIIGAGMSALAAGIRLAYYDKKVLICEKHAIAGGLNSYYRRKGRIMDVGLHAMTNFVSPKNRMAPLSKLLRQLKLKLKDFELVEQKNSLINFPDMSLRFTNDIEFIINEVAEKMPSQADGFRKLVKHIETYDALALDEDNFQSTREVLASFITEPLLIEMLMCPLMYYGSAWEDDMDFSQFAIMFRSILLEGFCRPHDGVIRIINMLTEKYKENGGEIRYRAGIEKILISNNKACGVRLSNGEEISADKVLSSAGVCETQELVDDSISSIVHNPGHMAFTEVIIYLDKYLSEFDYKDTIMFYNLTDTFKYKKPENLISLESGVICSPDNFAYELDSSLRPEPILRITNIANHKLWAGLSKDEYKERKEIWLDKILKNTSKLVPLDNTNIEYSDMFTPNTVKRYTSHINGTVYGSPEKIKDGRTNIDNLYICGTDQGFLGIVGSMLSGVSMANLHCLI
ncbi:NAD(P)/FAD-dependent oxidoreductase [bacterium]|nr:NAD(P)/FAD-dependent oxidoreductase [bacterium]